MQIITPIIPDRVQEVSNEYKKSPDLEAICVFAAIGFFLDDDTYWKNKKTLRPNTNYKLNSKKNIQEQSSYFKWYYRPRDISFDAAVNEFTELFEGIIKEQVQQNKVILPLSGGLDSRTQAVALKYLKANVSAYSYEFENGYSETKIAKQIATICDFDFQSFTIKKGYLWPKLDDLVKLNNCYSDFTSPRQMAIVDEFEKMGNIFSLGHWGDVLFDSYNLAEMTHEEQVQFLTQKLIKAGGLQLASQLWKVWQLKGSFETYFKQRISMLLRTIEIKNTNAKLRAFKSKYWAHRWTSVNLSIFSKDKPIALPYYDNKMCEWICTIPEAYLNNRQIQIAYIKKRNPNLAKITWQDQRPFNLYNYSYNRAPYNIPYKVVNKIKREIQNVTGKPYVQRNWELQFLGNENRKHLEKEINNSELENWISKDLIQKHVSDFYKEDYHNNAHALNMILVLAKFHQQNKNV